MSVASAAATSPTPSPVFRFYKTTDGSYFFTNSESESLAGGVGEFGIPLRRVAFYSYPTQVAGMDPVYRFYKFRQGVHFYTIDRAEAANIRATASPTLRDEGIASSAYSAPTTDTQPVSRVPKVPAAVHFYTSSSDEAAGLQTNASAI